MENSPKIFFFKDSEKNQITVGHESGEGSIVFYCKISLG